jgi:low molecular weight phosphotyrosine protein phosphatase
MPALTERCSANIVKQRQLDNVITRVDSAGTAAYHVNSSPDERTIAVCKKHGVPINSKGRKVTIGDFSTFDFILCMDHENLRNLEK